MAVIMLLLGTLSCLGYGPLAGVTVIGMQFLDFFDFLTNSVMMPIAAIATCLLVSRVIGVAKIEQGGHKRRSSVPQKSDLPVYDPVSLPGVCTDHSVQFRGKCIRLDHHVMNL